jgi:two-component system, cell cycle response regulator CpdR
VRILYVEDNPLVRDITVELLTQRGREIVAVASAEEAMELFQPASFDVVITDVSLPGLSGLDLARRIQQITASVPIVIASGYELALDPAQWGTRVRPITKPFEITELEDLLSALCTDSDSRKTPYTIVIQQ